MPCRTAPAGEQELSGLFASGSQVIVDRLTRLLRQLELDRPSRLLLPDGRSLDRVSIWSNVLDFDSDDVAAA